MSTPLPRPSAAPDGRNITESIRWRYALMNLGFVIPAQVSSFFFLYYVDHLKVDPVLFSGLMAAFAVYNALDNPVIGYLSDRTRTRWGRRRPYLWFGALPMLVALALIFCSPYDGLTRPTATLVWFGVTWWVWETASTAAGSGYLALLPEMFTTFDERSKVSVRMNIVQVVGLLIGLALPPVLASAIGWGPMAILFALVGIAALYAGMPALFERDVPTHPLSILESLQRSLANRSFLTVVTAQTMRFVATGCLAAGMGFYVKYTLGVDSGALTSILLALAFVTAGVCLAPWRRFVAARFEARMTLILAFSVCGLSVLPLAFDTGVPGAFATTIIFGVGLAGVILMGDVVMTDVIDEDEMRTGDRREASYFGLGGLITTLSGVIVSTAFGVVSQRYGYDPKLAAQPASVATGFRVFMVAPALLGCALAVTLMIFYPLHGARLRMTRERLAERRASA